MFELCDLYKSVVVEKGFYSIFEDMLSQFPEDEMKDFETFLILLKNPSYKLLFALEDGETIGYVIYLEDCHNKILWLDYIAVYKMHHSKGYGKKIIEALKSKYKNYKGIYLEVEKPCEKEINTLRRIKFYTRLEAQKTGINYFYPGKKGALSMDLYYLPISCPVLPEKEETLECIKNVFNRLHFDIANIKDVINRIN